MKYKAHLWLCILSILTFVKLRIAEEITNNVKANNCVNNNCDDDDDNDDDNASTSNEMFNFASYAAGAVILDKSPASAKGYFNLLTYDNDEYAVVPCNEKKWVVIGLSEDILVTSVALSNYERYSSRLKDFGLLASNQYPTTEWINLGKYTAENIFGEQLFNISEKVSAYTRYLKIKFLTHYQDEDLCTYSQVKVHGLTVIESLKQEVERSDNFTRDMLEHLNANEDVLTISMGITEDSLERRIEMEDSAVHSSADLSTDSSNSTEDINLTSRTPHSENETMMLGDMNTAVNSSTSILMAAVDAVKDIVFPFIPLVKSDESSSNQTEKTDTNGKIIVEAEENIASVSRNNSMVEAKVEEERTPPIDTETPTIMRETEDNSITMKDKTDVESSLLTLDSADVKANTVETPTKVYVDSEGHTTSILTETKPFECATKDEANKAKMDSALDEEIETSFLPSSVAELPAVTEDQSCQVDEKMHQHANSDTVLPLLTSLEDIAATETLQKAELNTETQAAVLKSSEEKTSVIASALAVAIENADQGETGTSVLTEASQELVMNTSLEELRSGTTENKPASDVNDNFTGYFNLGLNRQNIKQHIRDFKRSMLDSLFTASGNNHSAVVTDDETKVGEEMNERLEIAGMKSEDEITVHDAKSLLGIDLSEISKPLTTSTSAIEIEHLIGESEDTRGEEESFEEADINLSQKAADVTSIEDDKHISSGDTKVENSAEILLSSINSSVLSLNATEGNHSSTNESDINVYEEKLTEDTFQETALKFEQTVEDESLNKHTTIETQLVPSPVVVHEETPPPPPPASVTGMPSVMALTASSSSNNNNTAIITPLSCFELLSFRDFYSKKLAKMSKVADHASESILGGADSNVFKLLLQKIKALEVNNAILEAYTIQASDCYRTVLRDMINHSQFVPFVPPRSVIQSNEVNYRSNMHTPQATNTSSANTPGDEQPVESKEVKQARQSLGLFRQFELLFGDILLFPFWFQNSPEEFERRLSEFFLENSVALLIITFMSSVFCMICCTLLCVMLCVSSTVASRWNLSS